MATFTAKIEPLTLQHKVFVTVGQSRVEVPIHELTDEQLSELVEEYAANLMQMVETARKKKAIAGTRGEG